MIPSIMSTPVSGSSRSRPPCRLDLPVEDGPHRDVGAMGFVVGVRSSRPPSRPSARIVDEAEAEGLIGGMSSGSAFAAAVAGAPSTLVRSNTSPAAPPASRGLISSTPARSTD